MDEDTVIQSSCQPKCHMIQVPFGGFRSSGAASATEQTAQGERSTPFTHGVFCSAGIQGYEHAYVFCTATNGMTILKLFIVYMMSVSLLKLQWYLKAVLSQNQQQQQDPHLSCSRLTNVALAGSNGGPNP